MQGQAAYDRVVRKVSVLPGLAAIEIFGIFLPLAFHAGYGLWVMRDPSRRAPRSPYEPARVPSLQRATGAVTLLFLSYHLAEIRFAVATSALRPPDFHPTLAAMLSSTGSLGVPVAAVLYCIGLAAVSYHLAVGLTAFCFTFRLARTRGAHRFASFSGSVLGVLCFLLGARTIVYFAAGAPMP